MEARRSCQILWNWELQMVVNHHVGFWVLCKSNYSSKPGSHPSNPMNCLNWMLPGGKRNLKWDHLLCWGSVWDTSDLSTPVHFIFFPTGNEFVSRHSSLPVPPLLSAGVATGPVFNRKDKLSLSLATMTIWVWGYSADSCHPHCQVIRSCNIIFTSGSSNVLYKWYSLTFFK